MVEGRVSDARKALQCGLNTKLLCCGLTQSMDSDIKANRANMPTHLATSFIALMVHAAPPSSLHHKALHWYERRHVFWPPAAGE
jgi:hypothetical protein